MAQRILQPGEIEGLAQQSIPRIRLPAPAEVFALRAARLRALAPRTGIGAYLQFLAALVDAQHSALARIEPARPADADLKRAAEHGMPPIPAAAWLTDPEWPETLNRLCATLDERAQLPAPVIEVMARIRSAPPRWIMAQAEALLEHAAEGVEAAAAPLLMAALQVHGVARAARFDAATVRPLGVAGLCPLCGTEPVASRVCANSPYQGYRYLHCALCATEWHLVRVQCSICGASGKSIAYQSASAESDQTPHRGAEAAVRAETCDACHGYRKILYEEKDIAVEPLADDLASLSLDLLLGASGYHRAGSNPLLWQAGEK
ncbi:MAG TPA: formate dehydrogenase accessory protein FdhE [Steroidobacteraceae bacterium]|nr:formate dehydrogenase accessory protein FdhE [Steroidobacteraceae bacterium]